jgi:hypothetical protein
MESVLTPHPFQSYQPDWILGILLLCFAMVAWSQYFYRNRLKQILTAPFLKRYMSILLREGNLFSDRISVPLGLIYFLTVPLLAYETHSLLNIVPVRLNSFLLFLILCIALGIYWIAKYILMKLLGRIFRTYQTTREYLLNILVINFITGIALLPFLTLIVYLKSPFLLYISLAIFGISFLFRFVRGFLIGISLKKFSYLFLFVYLCSLEILPLIILSKILLTYYL